MFGQENINDRLGWHHVMMGVAPWPMILLGLYDLEAEADADLGPGGRPLQ